MKKIVLFFAIMFCFLSACNTDFAFAESDSSHKTYVICSNSTYLYELPDLTATRLKTLSHNTEVEILIDDNTPKEFNCGDYVFFKVVQFENTDCYVLADFVTAKIDAIVSTPNYNAKTNSACTLFFEIGGQMQASDISLPRHQEIFLYEGYNGKTEYTAVSFVYENQVLYGYLETKFVSPNGVNPIIITCILLILAILGIIFAWLFMKKKKVRIKKISQKMQKNDTKN